MHHQPPFQNIEDKEREREKNECKYQKRIYLIQKSYIIFP